MKDLHKKTEKHSIGCEDCQRQVPFEMPEGVINAYKAGKLVVFAGAGVSTEGKSMFPFSLYGEIQDELKISKNSLDFPDLMSKYVNKTHDKRLLLNKIKSRIDYSKSFPDLYARVTRFHNELSTIHGIQEIITTNWDDFFEIECGATPIVTDEDFAFWDQPYRKVFKIHGSINNPGSVIATKEDYEKCYKNLSKNAVGGSLRQLLATKTILFVGYSFRDYDFNKVYEYLHKTMGNILPHSYFVTLSDSIQPKFKNFSPTTIKTDATFFLKKLKERLVEEKLILPDSVYSVLFIQQMEIERIHFKFTKGDIQKDPSIVFCASYQDGLIHAFEKILKNKNKGQYSCVHHLMELIENYLKMREVFLKKKKYFDVAYIDGYITGLYQVVPELAKEVGFPAYYVFNSSKQLFSFVDYKKESKKAKKLHKLAYGWAEKIAMKYQKGMVLQHTSFLIGVSEEDIKKINLD